MIGNRSEVGALAGVPESLRTPLLEEFNKLASNFREARWEPAELNGGKLCEIVYTILRGHVDGNFPPAPAKPSNMLDACRALEQARGLPRSVRIQIPRVLTALYEIRNNRNVGHVGADVNPNRMDASIIFAMAQWIMAELVRIFHAVSTEEAGRIVETLVERRIPLIWRVGGRVRILNPALDAKDRMLVALYGTTGALALEQIVDVIEYSNLSQFRTRVVKPAHRSKLIDFDAQEDTVTLSPIGARYVEERVPLHI